MKKSYIFLILLLILPIIYASYSGSSVNFLAKEQADLLYCAIGDCGGNSSNVTSGSSVYTNVDNHYIINASSDTIGFNETLLNLTANDLIDKRVTQSFITNLGFILESTINNYFSTNFTYFENKINGLNNFSGDYNDLTNQPDLSIYINESELEDKEYINDSEVAFMNRSNSGNFGIDGNITAYSINLTGNSGQTYIDGRGYIITNDGEAGFFSSDETNYIAFDTSTNVYPDVMITCYNGVDGTCGFDEDIFADDYQGLWYNTNITDYYNKTEIDNKNYLNESEANKTYLNLSGKNANQNINISPYNLTAKDFKIPSMNGINGKYKTINDWFKLTTSAGRLTGGLIVENGTDGYVNVSEGQGFIRIADDDVSQTKFISWESNSSIPIKEGISYIGVEYNSGNPQITLRTSADWDLDTDFPLGTVINQSGDLYILNDPWWVGDGLTNVIERFQGQGTERDEEVGGLILGYTGTRNPTLTQGKVWARLNEFDITAKDCSGADNFTSFYRDGSGSWIKKGDFSQWNNTHYDDNSGTLQPMDNNKYANIWVFVQIDNSGGRLMLIYPQNQYVSSAQAEAEEVPFFPASWYKHGVLLGRILFKESVDIPIQVQSVFTTQFTPTQASDHSQLSNLDYSSSGHTGFQIQLLNNSCILIEGETISWNCSSIYIDIDEFDNSTIIRNGNTSWILANQNYNTSEDIWNVIDNNTFFYTSDQRYNDTDYISAVNTTLQTEINNRITNDTYQLGLINGKQIQLINNSCFTIKGGNLSYNCSPSIDLSNYVNLSYFLNITGEINNSMLTLTSSNTALIVSLTLETRNNITLVRNEIRQINQTINNNTDKIFQINNSILLINNTINGLNNFSGISNYTDANLTNLIITNNLTVENNAHIKENLTVGNATDFIIKSVTDTSTGKEFYIWFDLPAKIFRYGANIYKNCSNPVDCNDNIGIGRDIAPKMDKGTGNVVFGLGTLNKVIEAFNSILFGLNAGINLDYANNIIGFGNSVFANNVGGLENAISLGVGLTGGVDNNSLYISPKANTDDTPLIYGVDNDRIETYETDIHQYADEKCFYQGVSNDVSRCFIPSNNEVVYNNSELGTGFTYESIFYGDDDDKTLVLKGGYTVYDNDYQDLIDKPTCHGSTLVDQMDLDLLPSNFYKRNFVKNEEPLEEDDPWVCLNMEINSEYIEGTDIEIYLHLEDDDTAGCDVVTEVEMTCANAGGVFPPSTILNTVVSFPVGSPNDHILATMGTYSGIGLDISHTCNVIVKRVASDARDTCPSDKKIFFNTIERRFEENTLGARLLYTK